MRPCLPRVPARGVPGPVKDGASRDRTGDLLLAKQALSQLSYGPAAAETTRWHPSAAPEGRGARRRIGRMAPRPRRAVPPVRVGQVCEEDREESSHVQDHRRDRGERARGRRAGRPRPVAAGRQQGQGDGARRGLELRHRQGTTSMLPRTACGSPTTSRPSSAPPTARSRSRFRSGSPTARSTSSRASGSSTTAPAALTRAASATTPRSTSTRSARSAGGPGELSERQAVDPLHPSAGRGLPRALGTAAAGRAVQLPSDPQLHARCRALRARGRTAAGG
jgi:hypothetical protein